MHYYMVGSRDWDCVETRVHMVKAQNCDYARLMRSESVRVTHVNTYRPFKVLTSPHLHVFAVWEQTGADAGRSCKLTETTLLGVSKPSCHETTVGTTEVPSLSNNIERAGHDVEVKKRNHRKHEWAGVMM